MRRALTTSFLVHAVAIVLLAGELKRAAPGQPALAFELPASQSAASPDQPPADPILEEPQPVEEPIELDEPAPDVVEFDAAGAPSSPLASATTHPRRVRLSRPLRTPPEQTVAAPAEPAAPQEIAHPIRPRADGCPPPRYPPLARRLGQEGVVRLSLQIDAAGEVTDVTVRASSGHRLLDRAAIRAARSWRYHPARSGKRTMAGTIDQAVEFRLR